MAPQADRRVVVITGASSGIGRETAKAFAARGDWVVLVARRSEELARTLAACGGADAGRTVTCDVGDPEQVEDLANDVAAEEGRCDVLVNNAGIGARRAFDGPAALERLEQVMAVNFMGPARLMAHLLPMLKASAHKPAIINITSVAGMYGLPGSPMYGASKFALNGFSEAMHGTLAAEGVHLAWIQPGPLETEGFPHPWLARSRTGRLQMTTAEAVARRIVKASERRGPPEVVIPRFYRWGLFAKVVLPPFYRAALRRIGASHARARHATAAAAAQNELAPTQNELAPTQNELGAPATDKPPALTRRN